MSKLRNKVPFTLRLKTEQKSAFRHLGSSHDKSTAEAQHNESLTRHAAKKGLELHTNERTRLLSILCRFCCSKLNDKFQFKFDFILCMYVTEVCRV